MGRRKVEMSPEQRRRMFAMAGELGLDIDDLRDMASSYTGKPSIKSLSKSKAERLNKKLQLIINQKKQPDSVPPQIGLIKKLYPQLGLNEVQFREWLKRYFHVDHENFYSRRRPERSLRD